MEEIAETAGFTKGAVYANFASKEELFLAMLDERFAERAAEVERVFGTRDAPELQAREAGDEFTRFLAADRDWQRLFFEFAAHAGRDEAFREQLAARYRDLRARIADVLARRFAALGIEPPMPVDQLAMVAFSMGNGVALEIMLEPDQVPDDLLGRMFALLTSGLVAPD